VPDDTRFATKPELAREMITRALDAGVPAAWVAGDEVHGRDSKHGAAVVAGDTAARRQDRLR
jgi:SRSO17 transposase